MLGLGLRWAWLGAATLTGAYFLACSSSTGGGGGGSGGGAASSGAGGAANAGGIINADGSTGGSGGGLTDGGACAAKTTKAEQVPLDLYIMLDKSGSMLDLTGSTTKWDAVKQAISNFVGDGQSAGIGVGMQYFPLNQAGVPDSCTTNAQCGVGGPCLLKTCLGPGTTTITPCVNASTCSILDQCVDLGFCSGDPNTFCAPVGGTACGAAGNCVKIATSFCTNATTCLVGDYQASAVPIATLPGNASAIVASMNAQTPNGNTPTGPALQGAIQHAAGHKQANPDHAVVAVLATDGLPTSCNPTNISQIAQVAAAGVNGNPGVLTFVIGVFASTDTGAQANLNQIAAAGGTNTAFFVDPTTGNVTQQFLDALNQIKGQALACEFGIPQPEPGKTLDYDKINVEVSVGGNPTSLLYVGDAGKCDPTSGGWYYDIDPAGGTPTKIHLCPANCTSVKGATDAAVNVLVGCKTNTVPT